AHRRDAGHSRRRHSARQQRPGLAPRLSRRCHRRAGPDTIDGHACSVRGRHTGLGHHPEWLARGRRCHVRRRLHQRSWGLRHRPPLATVDRRHRYLHGDNRDYRVCHPPPVGRLLMLRILTAAAIGLVFGAGIAISGMANPAKVLNFFDIFGTWDPSLLLVMATALAVTFVGYRVVLRRPAPVLDLKFHLPGTREIDVPLVAGSALFGIGWGIAGFCPGGAIPALGLGEIAPVLFVAAMAGGMYLATILRGLLGRRQALA